MILLDVPFKIHLNCVNTTLELTPEIATALSEAYEALKVWTGPAVQT